MSREIAVCAPQKTKRSANLCRERSGACDDFTGIDPAVWVSRSDPAFPSRIDTAQDKTKGLWMRGAVDPRDAERLPWHLPAVSIVGSRAASGAGLEIAKTMAWELARAGVLAISGLARGIDGAAHECALLAGGSTVGVLACGLDICYPAEHKVLATEICHHGLLLSEWPEGEKPLAWRFPRRNRLISALADIVVVVEAEHRSGAFHTVRYALDQGREVMAVPRDPVTPGSAGPNRLIRDGATPAIGGASVLDLLAEITGRQSRDADSISSSKSPADQKQISRLESNQRHGRRSNSTAKNQRSDQLELDAADHNRSLAEDILAVLVRFGSQTIQQIIERLPGQEAAAIISEIMVLEVEARVSRDKMGRYQKQIAH